MNKRGKMKIPEKLEAMACLHVTDVDLAEHRDIVLEKCFCAALLNTTSDITGKVLSDYMVLRSVFYPGEYHVPQSADYARMNMFQTEKNPNG